MSSCSSESFATVSCWLELVFWVFKFLSAWWLGEGASLLKNLLNTDPSSSLSELLISLRSRRRWLIGFRLTLSFWCQLDRFAKSLEDGPTGGQGWL